MIGKMLENVRNKRPLVHCITNYVSANDCANALLAVGASPIMADDKNEAEDITGICSGLVLNLGTLSENKIEAMLISGKTANAKDIPVVLDPVGVGSSKFRMAAAKKIVSSIKIAVIRANSAEVKSLLYSAASNSGVDSDDEIEADISNAKSLANKLGCVVVLTGKTDVVTDGQSVYLVKNGHPMMKYVTGAGCQLSAVMGAFIGVNRSDVLLSALSAVCMMGLLGETAAKRLKEGEGSASLRTGIIDGLFLLTQEELEKGCKYEKYI